MFSKIVRSLKAMPMIQIAQKQGESWGRALAPMTVWGLPLGAGALWFCFPAIDDDFKASFGLNRSKPLPPAGVKYEYDSEEGDTMPVVKS